MGRWDIALCYGYETGEPRFGSEQVVTTRIQRPIGSPVADRQQLARTIEQETEVHRGKHSFCLLSNGEQSPAQTCNFVGRHLHCLDHRVNQLNPSLFT